MVYLGTCVGWPNKDWPGVVVPTNNPPSAGFFYSYFLDAPPKRDEEAKGWVGFENKAD